jgi:hypothetical protein
MHVLLNKFIPKRWLDMNLEHFGFGRISDIRKVKDAHIMGYLIKYLTKGLGNDDLEKALKSIKGRRVGFSRGMALPQVDKEQWLRVGAFECQKEISYLSQKMAIAGQRAGYQVKNSQTTTNFAKVEFSAASVGPREVYEHNERCLAENFRQSLYKKSKTIYTEEMYEKHRELAETVPRNEAWLDVFGDIDDVPDNFLLEQGTTLIGFGASSF